MNRYKKALRIFLWSYVAFLIFQSLLPLNSSGSALNHTFILAIRLDYLIHFAIFIPVIGLIWYSYKITYFKKILPALLWLLFGILVAVISEGLQYFIPYRAFNINDLVANSIGIVLGSFLFFISPEKRPEPNQNETVT